MDIAGWCAPLLSASHLTPFTSQKIWGVCQVGSHPPFPTCSQNHRLGNYPIYLYDIPYYISYNTCCSICFSILYAIYGFVSKPKMGA